MYTDDDLLSLSGIQHFAFCPRQWALAYVDMQWADNRLTIEGEWLHRHVDNPFAMQCDGSTVTLRSVPVKSLRLGLYGIADLLELHPLDSGSTQTPFTITRYPGRWQVFPVEYKHGRPKADDIDLVQLCAQAMSLEEMYGISIARGAFYYGATRHRLPAEFTPALRSRVAALSNQMHSLVASGDMPDALPQKKCRSCSLQDLCMSPDLRHATSVKNYLTLLKQ